MLTVKLKLKVNRVTEETADHVDSAVIFIKQKNDFDMKDESVPE